MVIAQNGECAKAVEIGSLPVKANGNTLVTDLHLDLPAEACGLVKGMRRSSWFSYVAQSAGCLTAKASVVDDPTTQEDKGFDTAIAVYSGNCTDLSCVAMNDDENLFNVNSVVHVDVTAGTSYKIMVTGWNTEVKGAFELDIEVGYGSIIQITGQKKLTIPTAKR